MAVEVPNKALLKMLQLRTTEVKLVVQTDPYLELLHIGNTGFSDNKQTPT